MFSSVWNMSIVKLNRVCLHFPRLGTVAYDISVYFVTRCVEWAGFVLGTHTEFTKPLVPIRCEGGEKRVLKTFADNSMENFFVPMIHM